VGYQHVERHHRQQGVGSAWAYQDAEKSYLMWEHEE
jgi:hypothetical protein